jgi:hypothetical protein
MYNVLPTFQTFISDLVDIWTVIFFNKILVICDFSDPYARLYADYDVCNNNYCLDYISDLDLKRKGEESTIRCWSALNKIKKK